MDCHYCAVAGRLDLRFHFHRFHDYQRLICFDRVTLFDKKLDNIPRCRGIYLRPLGYRCSRCSSRSGLYGYRLNSPASLGYGDIVDAVIDGDGVGSRS